MTVLIVDDNDLNRKLLRVTLQSAGHQTVEAGDGVEALATLKAHTVDAIISDILMPRMDGYRFCHAVRSIEQFRNILFIIYTRTYTSTPDEKLAIEFGADRFIRKPAPLKEVLDALAPKQQPEREHQLRPPDSLEELSALQGYSEVLVRKLEHRNSELQLTKEQLLRTNAKLVERTKELEAARARLEITANQLQSLFDNLDDVFFSIDMTERRLVQISPSCAKLYGLPQQAFFANPMLWTDLTIPADRHLIEEGQACFMRAKPGTTSTEFSDQTAQLCGYWRKSSRSSTTREGSPVSMPLSSMWANANTLKASCSTLKSWKQLADSPPVLPMTLTIC